MKKLIAGLLLVLGVQCMVAGNVTVAWDYDDEADGGAMERFRISVATNQVVDLVTNQVVYANFYTTNYTMSLSNIQPSQVFLHVFVQGGGLESLPSNVLELNFPKPARSLRMTPILQGSLGLGGPWKNVVKWEQKEVAITNKAEMAYYRVSYDFEVGREN